jgi:hypothetical protein
MLQAGEVVGGVWAAAVETVVEVVGAMLKEEEEAHVEVRVGQAGVRQDRAAAVQVEIEIEEVGQVRVVSRFHRLNTICGQSKLVNV